MKALIVYHTKTGHTRRAADDIAAGLRDEGVESDFVAARKMKGWDVGDAAIVAVGSPCHAGSLALRGGLSGPIREALARLEPTALAGKVAGAFSVHCGYGAHRTVRAIEGSLVGAGARLAAAGVVVQAGTPFSLFVGPMASQADRDRLREFGRELARAAKG